LVPPTRSHPSGRNPLGRAACRQPAHCGAGLFCPACGCARVRGGLTAIRVWFVSGRSIPLARRGTLRFPRAAKNAAARGAGSARPLCGGHGRPRARGFTPRSAGDCRPASVTTRSPAGGVLHARGQPAVGRVLEGAFARGACELVLSGHGGHQLSRPAGRPADGAQPQGLGRQPYLAGCGLFRSALKYRLGAGNRTWSGAEAQAVLMSVIGTCIVRALDPLVFLVWALTSPAPALLAQRPPRGGKQPRPK